MSAEGLALGVYVCTDPGVPVFGTKGSSAHVRAVLAELAHRADEVQLVTLRCGGDPEPALAGVHVHELQRPGGDASQKEVALVAVDRAVAERIDRVVGRRRPDVVYQRFSLWSCAPMELAAQRRWPSVLEINAPLIDEQAHHRELVDRGTAEARAIRAIRAATVPFAVTAEVAAWAECLAGRRVAVIPNGVDPGRFVIGERRDHPADQRAPVTIGFVGTYKPWHDLDAIVATVDHVSRQPDLPPVRLLLVGDGPELAGLLDRLDALEAVPAVTVTGAVPADRVPALLAEMDIALAPYGLEEQYFSPLKIFEYLAAGVAVVASRIGGLCGLADGHEALLVPPGDRHAFAGAVARLCADPAARAALGRAGRDAARSRHGWHLVVDRILSAVASGSPR